jgi:hypothetical protein
LWNVSKGQFVKRSNSTSNGVQPIAALLPNDALQQTAHEERGQLLAAFADRNLLHGAAADCDP